jgi:hypothetical protein
MGLRARAEEGLDRPEDALNCHRRIIELCLERKTRGHRRTLRAYHDLELFQRRMNDLEAAEVTRIAYHAELNWLVNEVIDEEKS